MIKLPNGDFWITENLGENLDKHLKLAGWDKISKNYKNLANKEYIEEHKLYDTDYKDFIDTVYAHYFDSGYDEHGNDKHPFLSPRKLTHEKYPDGYWDSNFEAIEEIFAQIGRKTIKYCWGAVYESPWDEVYVTWTETDSGGYDSCMAMKKFYSWNAWLDYLEVGEK